MKVLKNTYSPFRCFLAVLVLGVLLLGGCSNLFHEKTPETPLRRWLCGGEPNPRSGGPDPASQRGGAFLYPAFTRTSPSALTVIETLGGGASKTVGLEAGTWDLAVYGYRNPMDAYPLGTPAGTPMQRPLLEQ
jgi:hypothetical protein